MAKQKNEKNRYEKYSRYIKDNLDTVTEKVTKYFDEKEEDSVGFILEKIRRAAMNAVHYEWKTDDCPYDSSGVIVKNGKVDKDISIEKFLNNEYTGTKEATYTGGYGFAYNNYDDIISLDTQELAEKLMRNSIEQQLQEAFSDDVIDDEIVEDVTFQYHDNIYNNCPATEFFTCTGSLRYYGVDLDMTLEKLYKEKK